MIWYKATEEKKVLMHTHSEEMAVDYNLIETCEDDGLETAWDGSIWVKGYAPAEPEEEIKKREKQALIAQLDAIDLKTIRALRAMSAGTGTEADKKKLEDLEEQAAEIRQQLKELGA